MRFVEIAAFLEDERCRSQLERLAMTLQVDGSLDLSVYEWRFVQTPQGTYRDYMVSNAGHVLSLPRYRRFHHADGSSYAVHRKFQPGRLLRAGRHPKGYRTVILYYEGRKEPFYIHQLVAWAFIGQQSPGYIIRHRDGNTENNNASNLEYALASPQLYCDQRSDAVNRKRRLQHSIGEALAGRRDPHLVLREIMEYLEENQ